MSQGENMLQIYSPDGIVIHNLTQWDAGQSFYIFNEFNLTEAPLFHFCNSQSEEALIVTATLSDNKITVDIPNILLQEPYSIIAYMYCYSTDTSARSIIAIKIPVRKRPKPSQYKYVENIEVTSIKRVEAQLNNLISRVETNTTKLEETQTVVTTLITDATEATNNASVAAKDANDAKDAANTAADRANTATDRANKAADDANEAAHNANYSVEDVTQLKTRVSALEVDITQDEINALFTT